MNDTRTRQSTDQSSESVKRVASPDPTDGRTEGLTKNLQDSSGQVTFLNAHEKNASPVLDIAPLSETLAAVGRQIIDAAQRMPYTRTGETRRLLDPQVRRMVLMRDRYTCQWCRRHVRDGARFEVDHIVPWSAGGTNCTDNLRALCEHCNQTRSNRRTDAETATALLIVGTCPWCRGRHYVSAYESEDDHGTFVYDEDAAEEIGQSDREVPVWCIGCRGQSSTSVTHANRVRAKQADRWAPEGYVPEPREDAASWQEGGS